MAPGVSTVSKNARNCKLRLIEAPVADSLLLGAGIWPMMGERRVMQEALFYGFSLERHVEMDVGSFGVAAPKTASSRTERRSFTPSRMRSSKLPEAVSFRLSQASCGFSLKICPNNILTIGATKG